MDFRSVFLPYCLMRQTDGSYVVTNREYKPLGFRTDDFYRYEDFPIAHKIVGMTKSMAAKIDCDHRDNLDVIYLYNDACVPTHKPEYMQDYLKRLALLAKLQVEQVE